MTTDFDADLARTVRQTSRMRQLFYAVVLLVALTGQVWGAHEALHLPLLFAIPAVAALELGGIVVLSNADVRRRLGERATGSRVLSAAIAAGAVAFNWTAHDDKLLAGFFAGMSALGYLVWLMHTENQRRDRLRATGDLPPTTPAYELVGHWLRHPALTMRAKSLAKADASLGLYASLDAAREQIRRERQHAAIAKVLHRKIRAAVDPTTADIATATYDLGQVAARLADAADYDGLTALIAADLTADRLAAPNATPTTAPAAAAPPVPTADEAPPVTVDAAAPAPIEAPAAPKAAPVKAPAKASKRQPSAAARVASAVARSPRASDATIAARLGLSEATVKRHRRQAVDSVSTASTPVLHAA
ncbi:hypothetical protein [Dactylosporangium sp. NPDC000521]|uniref:hypothetical protein n=1 Tax=Dactylosporangium sp. NPDC000521 TaxID=3363975 RepID=UPI0036C7DC46